MFVCPTTASSQASTDTSCPSIESLHRNAFILAVRAIIVDVPRKSRMACECRNTRITQEGAVRGARAHRRNDGDARPEFRGQTFHGLNDFRIDVERPGRDRRGCQCNADLTVRQNTSDRAPNGVDGFARKDAAIDVCSRRLWKSVDGVSSVEHRCHTGRSNIVRCKQEPRTGGRQKRDWAWPTPPISCRPRFAHLRADPLSGAMRAWSHSI